MSKSNQESKTNNTEEVSFMDLVSGIKKAIAYILQKWLVILFCILIGGILGWGYAAFKKPSYTAVCTFVLEDNKTSGGLGQYAGIASLAGINIGGASGGGIFEGDNILELYKSRTMIEKALLSEGVFNGKKQQLIDRYLDYNKLRQRWKDDGDGLNNINFNGDPDKFNRKQDSIITDLVDLFNLKLLDVTKPDKKLNIIRVEIISKDELFSKLFTEKLVATVNDFYVETKTEKAAQSVQILQRQADSVKRLLDYSINGVASAIDAAPNANPLMSALRTTSQKRQVDVQTNSAIYAEVVKNLELEKISLRQETPLIQVVDKPVLPLLINRVSKIKGIVVGMVLGLIIALTSLIAIRIYNIMLS